MKNKFNKPNEQLHVRCILHIVNLAVKDFFDMFHVEVHSLRSLVSAINYSVKRRNLFGSAKKTLNTSVSMQGLDCEARWSSTFKMIQEAYNAK